MGTFVKVPLQSVKMVCFLMIKVKLLDEAVEAASFQVIVGA